MGIRRIGPGEAGLAAPLFAAYRQFYKQSYDGGVAEAFLRERLAAAESVVLLAELDGPPVGFAQLYPGFSSIAARPAWVLGDLYVQASERGKGVGAALMQEAERLARVAGAAYLALETARDNLVAQRLYERAGFRLDDRFLTYEKPLGD